MEPSTTNEIIKVGLKILKQGNKVQSGEWAIFLIISEKTFSRSQVVLVCLLGSPFEKNDFRSLTSVLAKFGEILMSHFE